MFDIRSGTLRDAKSKDSIKIYYPTMKPVLSWKYSVISFVKRM
jgi:hypothetical protein